MSDGSIVDSLCKEMALLLAPSSLSGPSYNVAVSVGLPAAISLLATHIPVDSSAIISKYVNFPKDTMIINWAQRSV